MLDPFIQAEEEYRKKSVQNPISIVLGQKQLRMIEELVNYLNDQNMIFFDASYSNKSKWRGMTIKIDNREDYIGFE